MLGTHCSKTDDDHSVSAWWKRMVKSIDGGDSDVYADLIELFKLTTRERLLKCDGLMSNLFYTKAHYAIREFSSQRHSCSDWSANMTGEELIRGESCTWREGVSPPSAQGKSLSVSSVL